MASPVITVELTRVGADRMQVAVRGSLSGEAGETVALPYAAPQRSAINLALEAQSFRPADWSGAANAPQLALLCDLGLAAANGFAADLHERVGRGLFAALFPDGSLREALHTTLDADASAASPARVELRLNTAATDLGAYPWELLYDDERQKFLFARPTAALVRYINYSRRAPPLLTAARLQVLYVAARPIAPEQVAPLTNNESAAVRRGLEQVSPTGEIELIPLPPASPAASTFGLLQQYLAPGDAARAPHVLHFDGHGGFGLRCPACGSLNGMGRATCFQPHCRAALAGTPRGYLAFERTDRGVQWVSAEELANLVEGSGIRLVVLSACLSAAAAGQSLFNGVAPALIGAGVPAVVAMKYSILDEAASCFAEVFYRNLAQRASLAAALSQVRARLKTDFPNSWYRPVLYLRTNEQNVEGRLFAKKKALAPPKRTTDNGAAPGGTVIVYGDHANRDIIKDNTFNVNTAPGGATWPAAPGHALTGDYQIDQVLQALDARSAGKPNVQVATLFPQMCQLFRRAAFEEHPCRQNPESGKLLLYVITATELIVREYQIAVIAAPSPILRDWYDELRRELLAYRADIAVQFGPAFSLAGHIDRYGMSKDAFVNALPDLVSMGSCEDAEEHRQKIQQLSRSLFD